MAKKKVFFIKSSNAAFEDELCDKCSRRILEVQDGSCYWNPNRRAQNRNVCKDCYDEWELKRYSWRQEFAINLALDIDNYLDERVYAK